MALREAEAGAGLAGLMGGLLLEIVIVTVMMKTTKTPAPVPSQ